MEHGGETEDRRRADEHGGMLRQEGTREKAEDRRADVAPRRDMQRGEQETGGELLKNGSWRKADKQIRESAVVLHEDYEEESCK